MNFNRLRRFPHTRGGGPYTSARTPGAYEFSPHAWGWTSSSQTRLCPVAVFPTRVGVDLYTGRPSPARRGFPHTRGGGPRTKDCIGRITMFSPHAWGWTASLPVVWREAQVFPTRVGVDRDGRPIWSSLVVFPTRVGVDLCVLKLLTNHACFPHTRGGGPAGRGRE